MDIVFSRATTKKMTKKKNSLKSLKEFKWYTRKYPLKLKEIVKEEHMNNIAIENEKQNSNWQFNHIDNNIKCDCIKSNQKKEIVRLDKKTMLPLCVSIGDTLESKIQ